MEAPAVGAGARPKTLVSRQLPLHLVALVRIASKHWRWFALRCTRRACTWPALPSASLLLSNGPAGAEFAPDRTGQEDGREGALAAPRRRIGLDCGFPCS